MVMLFDKHKDHNIKKLFSSYDKVMSCNALLREEEGGGVCTVRVSSARFLASLEMKQEH